MPRSHDSRRLLPIPVLANFGLTVEMVANAVTYVHEIIDSIDEKLLEAGGERLAELVELANLSAIIGNLFRGGVVRFCEGKFAANTPHTYPDLLGRGEGCVDVEIKVALEENNPKGHLIKPGPHITLRYVLAKETGEYRRGKEHRGNVAWIWEVRIGMLKEEHFNVSNTTGDSGKTAVINAAGMEAMSLIYFDTDHCPLSPKGAAHARVTALLKAP